MKDLKTLATRAGIAAGISLLALFPILKSKKPDAPGAGAGHQPKVSSAKQGSLLATPTYDWKTGDEASYDYEISMSLGEAMDSRWKMEANGGASATALRGQIHFVVLEAGPSGATLACQGSGIQVTADGQRDSMMEDLLNRTPQTITLSPNGRVLSRSFPRRVAVEDRHVLAGLTQTQWVLGSGESWTTTETDAAGEYRCAYRRGEGPAMTKTRATRPAEAGEVSFTVVKSSFRGQRGDFWLQSVEGEEESALRHEGKTIMTLVSKARLVRLAKDAVPAELRALSMQVVRDEFVDEVQLTPGSEGVSTAERKRRARLQEKYGQLPLAVVFNQLKEAVAKSREHADTLPAIDALRDWIEANPDKAKEVTAALRERGLSQEVTSRAVHALELAGREVPQAQDALGDLLKDRDAYTDDTVLQAIVASGDVKELRSPKIFDALRDIIANPRAGNPEDFQWSDAALFSVGRLAEQNPRAKDALISALTPRLENPQDYGASDLVTALQSLGNGRVADETMLQRASALANHAEPEVRAALVDYMHRAYPTDLAAAKRAMQDPSELVQSAGVSALAHPETATAESLAFLRGQESRQDLAPQIKEAISGALNQHAELAARFASSQNQP